MKKLVIPAVKRATEWRFALQACSLASCAPAVAVKQPPEAPVGILQLDRQNPVVHAMVNGNDLLLRVALDAKDVVELNPSAVSRLGLAFEPGFNADVGRVTLPGISATASITITGHPVLALLSSHGRDCCAGVDGTISPALLPFAEIRFADGASAGGRVETLVLEHDEEHGLEAPVTIGAERISLQFSLERPDTQSSSSAGAILARAYRGHFAGAEIDVDAAFGIKRPARTIAFPRSISLAGFAFDHIATRIADFAGRYDFPADRSEPGDIVVKRRTTQQQAWPVVSIGRDHMDRCGEIAYHTQTHLLSLRCDFDG
ncbi:MAG: hypothetical protein JF564_00110 [Sphingomonas sp.]|nr:hypothetical protein [Sphingomonas sp.]